VLVEEEVDNKVVLIGLRIGFFFVRTMMLEKIFVENIEVCHDICQMNDL